MIKEGTQHHRCRHFRILLLHPPHHHTQMLGLDNDTDTARLYRMHYGIRNLLGQVFLDLQTRRKHVHDTCYF